MGAQAPIKPNKEDTAMKQIPSTRSLNAQRAHLVKLQLKEYQTRGNTEHCQNLWKEICKIDEELARRASK